MCAVALRRPVRTLSVASLPGARKGPFPGYVESCDPTLREHPPKGDWLYEIKADGFRIEALIDRGAVSLHSRTKVDWTERSSGIAEALKELPVRQAIIDGEAIVLGKTGLPDFQALLRKNSISDAGRLQYWAFDLLYLNGFDLRNAPYVERKRLLQDLLVDTPENIVYVEGLGGDGEQIFRHACRMGLEGVVAKRPDAPYRSGRQESWIKLKCVKSDTFPIIAFVEKLGAKPRRIASLYIGRHDGNQLRFAKHVVATPTR